MLIISAKLRRLRQVFGYSQEYVAFNLGMSQPAYCKWESGKTHPSIDKLEFVAGLYQLTLGEFLQGNDTELLRRLFTDGRLAEAVLGKSAADA